MKYSRVHLESIGYELAPNVVTSASLEERLAPLYQSLRLQRGQLEALTGIRERRWWDPDQSNAEAATRAAQKAMAESGINPADIGVVVYGGVCRDHIEPATACEVAARLGLSADCELYDLSNACLGAVNGILQVANRIELGQVRAGLIVSCESAREITEIMIDRMLAEPTMDFFKVSLATLTGGSGAVAIVLSGDSSRGKPRLAGGVMKAAPEHHAICRWEFAGAPGSHSSNGHAPTQFMSTDAISVLKHGVVLGMQTWEAFLRELDWRSGDIDAVICHQVGKQNRESILRALSIPEEMDFSTYEYLGNMGTVSLPLTAAVAAERGILERGQRVAFLGIGSGLNCLMLGWEW